MQARTATPDPATSEIRSPRTGPSSNASRSRPLGSVQGNRACPRASPSPHGPPCSDPPLRGRRLAYPSACPSRAAPAGPKSGRGWRRLQKYGAWRGTGSQPKDTTPARCRNIKRNLIGLPTRWCPKIRSPICAYRRADDQVNSINAHRYSGPVRRCPRQTPEPSGVGPSALSEGFATRKSQIPRLTFPLWEGLGFDRRHGFTVFGDYLPESELM